VVRILFAKASASAGSAMVLAANFPSQIEVGPEINAPRRSRRRKRKKLMPCWPA
jgi:hypothetical protein